MSFIEPHRKFIDTDVRPLRATLAGMTANPRTKAIASTTLPQIPY
jgi:hypothetical protein